jgi:hypothetical protein
MQIDKNKQVILGVVGVIVLVGVFYLGVFYGKNQTSASTRVNGQASTFGSGAQGIRGSGGFSGNTSGKTTFGQIISKDATSITVQLETPQAGSTTNASGSKIIFLGQDTKVTKQASGTLSDLAVGTNVSVTGTTNTDGSVSASSIQIRPVVEGSGNKVPMIPAQ